MKSLKKIINVLFLLCAVVIAFSGCQNFLRGAELKNEIDNIIEYETTPDVTVKISANSLYGSLTAETGGIYKLGSSHEISFKAEDDYQFCSWEVYNTQDELVDCTENDVIYILDKTNPETTFIVKQNVSGYKITANCQLRPAVTIATPQFQLSGVNRDRDIILNFNMEINVSNFRFSQDEVAQLEKDGNSVEDYRDAEGRAYGYCTKNGVVYYKNIKIRNENKPSENLLVFFGVPEVSGSKLIISPKKGKDNQFELDSNGLKDIRVTVSNLENSSGIKMFKDYEYSYRVSENTDAQTKVTVQNENTTGKLVSSGSGKYSVGAEIKLTFTENADYKFLSFNIVESDESKVTAAVTSVSYDPAQGVCEAVVTVLEGDGDVLISTECTPRPVIKSFSPAYTAPGTTFDSSIVLNLGASVARESFIYSETELAAFGETAVAVKNDKDEIMAVDVAGKRYFKNISIVDNQNENIAVYYSRLQFADDNKTVALIFDSTRLFDFGESSTKEIYVTVGPEVYSVYEKDSVSEKILLSDKLEPQSFSFRIRNASEGKAKITFSVLDESVSPSANMGILNYSETQEFSLGQKVTVTFTPASDYDFIRWSVTGVADDSILFEDDKTNTNLVFTVLGAADGITIKPYCEKINTSRLLFSTSSGTISPSGYVNVRRNETVDLICKVSEKNCFAKWNVVNTVSGDVLPEEKYTKYFEFGDIKSAETTVKVLFDSKNLSIVAETYLRPAVYDHDPMNQITGTNKDQAIRIFITPGIDEESLYYSDSEANEFKNQGYKLLDAGNDFNHKYYGYYKAGDDNSIVYKNIKITNRANVDENLLKHYGAPYIQDSKGTVVVIPPTTVRENLPPEYKEILVTLGTEYGYYVGGEDNGGKTLIGLYDNNLVFSYKTNNQEDETEPSFKIDDFRLKGKMDSDIKVEISGTSEKLTDLPASGVFNYDYYKNYYIKPESDGSIKLDFDIKFEDAGMNINTFSICMEKVRDYEYKAPDSKIQYEYVLPYKSSSTDYSFTQEDFNFSDFLAADGSMDGMYKIWFNVKDLSGHSATTENSKFYYVLIDRAAPHMIEDKNFVYYVKNGSVKIDNMIKAKDPDTVKTYIQFQDKPIIEITSDGFETVECGGLGKYQSADIKIITEDRFENTHVYDSSYNPKFAIETGAHEDMYMYKDGYFSEFININEDICGLVVTADYSGDKNEVGVMIKETYKAKLVDVEAGNLPVPELTGKLDGNISSYEIPSIDIWKNKIGLYDSMTFKPVNGVDNYQKFEKMGSPLDTNPYGIESMYYVARKNDYILYSGKYYTYYVWYESKPSTYNTISSNTKDYLIKYLVTYEDTAE